MSDLPNSQPREGTSSSNAVAPERHSLEGGNLQSLITEHLDIWTAAIKTKSSAGRGSSKKLELVGVKKLRELILELAVRGKLVPQDPNVEPASELLKKIEVEKAELIKEGKIKKQKPLPDIEDEETFSELPKGWVYCRLNDLVYLLGDGLHGTPEYADDGDYYFVNGNNLTNGKIIIKPETKKVAQDQFDKYKKTLTENTVLVSINGTLGNVAFYNEEKIVLGKSACYFNLANCISKVFIKRLIESPRFINYAFAKASGSTIKNLGLKAMNLHVIALPPLAEQKRIVAKVDELMALCDQLEAQTESSIQAHQLLVETLLATLTNAKDADELNENWQTISQHFDVLFTTQASIDQLKQTILQLAVMGKLVKQDPKDEPASKLLERIATEKQQLIKAGKIKKQKPLSPITDAERTFELPKGWQWTKLDNLAIKSEAGWSPQCNGHPRVGDNWGVLKVSAVSWGKYNPNENKELPESLEPRPVFEVKPGDFLISRANTAELVAKAVVVPADTPEKLMMSDKIIRFNFSSLANLDFIQLINNSNQARSYYATVAGGTSSSMKNVSREQIRNLVFALPSMKEQHRIVAKVDELMTLCDSFKARLDQAQTIQLHLTDTIVEQALN